ncbi:PLAC8-like protein 1 [Anolis sagrei]|uniref:PLAC8-like protein 1 n=1 Tax=Anolis sagrei TaxID=38937 RepID=UPI003522F8B8
MDKLMSCCFVAPQKKHLSDTIQSPLIFPLSGSEDWNDFLFTQRSQISTEPVTTQPSPTGAATSSITTIIHTGGNWSTGLFDVCSDKKVCLCGSLCFPFLECSLASRHGECLCFPLLLGSTMALRAGTRERYKIHGTLCEDWMAVHCCWPFAVCQMAREMKRRPIFQLYKVHQSSMPPPFRSALV